MKPNEHPKGLLIVLSSPSGGGKTTIAHDLLRKDKNVVRSISCTTRQPREGERNGRDYFFITEARFKNMVKKKMFLEWAKVHRHYYGTPRDWVEEQIHRGKDVLFVIDVQGGKIIKRKAEEAVLVFVRPPSFTVLKERLVGRQTDDPKTIEIRLRNARGEMMEGKRYDYQVVNDRLSTAVAHIRRIIRNEREKRLKSA
jgi:guanylate kinase